MEVLWLYLVVWFCLVTKKVWESWKKNKVFGLFFTMKPSRLKIMEKNFIFFVVRLVVILFGCQESVEKLKKK